MTIFMAKQAMTCFTDKKGMTASAAVMARILFLVVTGLTSLMAIAVLTLFTPVRKTIAFTEAMDPIYCLATGAMTTYLEKWVPTLSPADWVLMCLRSRSILVEQT